MAAPLPLVVNIVQPKNVYTPLYTSVFVHGKAFLVWNNKFADKWEGKYAEAQRFVDLEVLRQSDPYIPFRTGRLIKSGIVGTVIGSGTVAWVEPYARYQYYGKVMSSNPFAPTRVKVVTNRNLVYHGGGKRGSYWFARMKEVSGDKITGGAKKIIGGP